MDEKALRSIIEQVLTEMNLNGGASSASASTAESSCGKCETASAIEEGCIPDLTEVDIRTQYLVKNPEHEDRG